ncbi:G patch domain-containing protein 4 [Egretta garzetta]|uniref:G patch domain-containing protein 4 n=1 Tax=Egretta garzetta TaxID=188379 RepID=UPI00163BEE26|nr:G patch domain-containing protein 4 [Egretta garzetta]
MLRPRWDELGHAEAVWCLRAKLAGNTCVVEPSRWRRGQAAIAGSAVPEPAVPTGVEPVPGNGISVKTLSEQGVRISNKKPRKAGSSGSMLYGRFVKSATLTACGEEPTKLPTGSESSEEEEKLDLSSARRLTDEELMRACGGRTAHKGARHGLTMSAKLARLEEQERAFLATYRQKEQQREPPESSPPAGRQEKRKKKKRKQSRDGADPEVLQSQEPSGEEEVVGEESKVVKRKKKNQEPSGEEEERDTRGQTPQSIKIFFQGHKYIFIAVKLSWSARYVADPGIPDRVYT